MTTDGKTCEDTWHVREHQQQQGVYLFYVFTNRSKGFTKMVIVIGVAAFSARLSVSMLPPGERVIDDLPLTWKYWLPVSQLIT